MYYFSYAEGRFSPVLKHPTDVSVIHMGSINNVSVIMVRCSYSLYLFLQIINWVNSQNIAGPEQNLSDRQHDHIDFLNLP